MKYYFENQDSESCYAKRYFIKDREITEMQVYPAKMIKQEGYAWCSEFGDAVLTGTGDCGKNCSSYKPRNGKNGRCRFSKNCYEPVDEPVKLKLKKMKL